MENVSKKTVLILRQMAPNCGVAGVRRGLPDLGWWQAHGKTNEYGN
jgi:hypothetical protein